MRAGVLGIIQEDLQLVNQIISKYYRLRSGHLGQFAHIEIEAYEEFLRPCCVLLTAKMLSQKGQKFIALASIFQLIYLASRVHLGVPEDHEIENPQEVDYRDGNQLPVLAGDYLYGRFFTTLCEFDLNEYLSPIAEVIATMSEGAIKRIEAKQNNCFNRDMWLESLEMEQASLWAAACGLTAKLAQADNHIVDYLTKFGQAIGMLWSLRTFGQVEREQALYLKRATEQLENLKAAGFDIPLSSLLEFVKREIVPGKISLVR